MRSTAGVTAKGTNTAVAAAVRFRLCDKRSSASAPSEASRAISSTGASAKSGCREKAEAVAALLLDVPT